MTEATSTPGKAGANSNGYSAEDIKVLDGIEAVRKRPAMYIGDTGERGLHHLVYEAVDNAVDEHLAGRCKTIKLTLYRDGSVSVEDDGGGIPVEMHPEEGVSALEVVMTRVHAGGKFGKKGYKVSGGLHGVGVKCANALSEWCEVEVRRDGGRWVQKYSRGAALGPVARVGEATGTGTKIRFLPDKEIFRETAFKYDTLAKRMREIAFLNPGLSVYINDERTGKTEHFHYPRGIKAFVEYLNAARTPIHKEAIYIERRREESPAGIGIRVAMQWNDGYAEQIFSFCNNINTIEGGTHLSG
ncbi:MAG: ATP-binding protein, partial [Planctomycetota bacterium]|nr:ATP-binding protein [Planctomycetota bacterium]